MNKKNVFIGILVVLILVGAYFYKFVLYKDARNISEEDASFKLTSTQLVNEFKTNENQASTKYANKTIEVSGTVKEKNDSTLTLSDGIFCSFSDATQGLEVSSQVKVKGRVNGYDGLLEEVKLDQCTITK